MTSKATDQVRDFGLVSIAERLNDSVTEISHLGAPLLDLIIRLTLAVQFFRTGMLKTIDPEPTVWLFTFVHPVPGLSPESAAWLLTIAELVAPILILFGLATRIAALILLGSTALLHLAFPAVADHLYVMLLLGGVIIAGPKRFSLDHKFLPALVSSALPMTGAMLRLGPAISRYLSPLYMAFLRLALAAVFGVAGWTALTGMDLTGFEYAKRYGVTFMDPSANSVVVGFLELFFAGLLAAGLAGAGLFIIVLIIHFGFVAESHHGLLLLTLAYVALAGSGSISIDQPISRQLKRLFPSMTPQQDWLADAPRVVIVGGGFGGIAAALSLRHARARVTLVDRRNYHLFQPLLYQVATASLSPSDIATPIRALTRGLANCQVVMGRVTAVDKERGEVVTEDGTLPYDYLVLATGAKHSYFGKDEWEPYAPGLKKIDDATQVRRDILLAFERAETAKDHSERNHLMTFVIVGGGPTGVELAGAIAELARQGMAEEFDVIDPANSRVILVQASSRILPAMPERLSKKAQRALENLGVEVRIDSRVDEIDEAGVVVAGERIYARTVIWAARVAASPAGRWVDADRDPAGRVIVGKDLSVDGSQNVYAIGDTAHYQTGEGSSLPGLAAVAKQQGKFVAKLLRARIEGRPLPTEFRYRDYGSMATIGREQAVADLRGLQLSGTAAWWLWSIVHVAFMADVRNRLSVIIDWTWSYLTFSRRIRLITGRG